MEEMGEVEEKRYKPQRKNSKTPFSPVFPKIDLNFNSAQLGGVQIYGRKPVAGWDHPRGTVPLASEIPAIGWLEWGYPLEGRPRPELGGLQHTLVGLPVELWDRYQAGARRPRRFCMVLKTTSTNWRGGLKHRRWRGGQNQ